MNEWKEVWYVWSFSEHPIPDEYIHTAIDSNGNLLWWTNGEIKSYMNECKTGKRESSVVVTYTLGEKRRRCVACKGAKTIKQIGTYGENKTTTCYRCNGIGYEFKKR